MKKVTGDLAESHYETVDLSTGGDTNSSFTDTRSYFDVTCECVVGYRAYTDRPFASDYNCAAGEEIRGHNGKSLPFKIGRASCRERVCLYV